ncbi:hypothetical protein EVAR_76701_1 [Eumeta japonica]|uniref:Uncharacterized protein n=1 Tax=Eumeta variegata TaxID=151549 RepID=A0A4C1SV73_EUMVA|nr:hypothetical protein EVAR_76701_1 [Eumeta japonica]
MAQGYRRKNRALTKDNISYQKLYRRASARGRGGGRGKVEVITHQYAAGGAGILLRDRRLIYSHVARRRDCASDCVRVFGSAAGSSSAVKKEPL